MDNTSKVLLVTFLMVVTLLPLGQINNLVVYENNDYKIDQINAHLDLALVTSDVDAKVQYIDDTIVSLKDWHGNGEWWFPMDNTDIDITRELLVTLSNDVRDQRDVKNSEQYFVLPHNELVIYMDTQIESIDDRLHDYARVIHFNPSNNIGHWTITPLLVLSTIILIGCLLFKIE